MTEPRHRASARVVMLGAALIVSIIVLCFAALEWLLRETVFDPGAAYIRTPGWSMKVRTNDLLPHVSGDHLFLVNRLGIRGDPPPSGASPRIAVLGGSTVEDWVLPDAKTWAQQLASQLRTCRPDVWVANFGKGGVNARHHLIQLPETEKYMPRYDMFVVLLGLNDLLLDLRIHHPLVLPEGWWRRQALMYDHFDEGAFAMVALSKRIVRQFVLERGSGGGASDFGYYMKHLWDVYAKVTSEQWVATLPDLSAHLDTYRQTIVSLKRYADAYGAPIVFVSQPYVWSDRMSPETKAQIFAGFIGSELTSPRTKWYTVAALEKGLSTYNAALMEMCRTDRLLCVDAADKIPREARYFFDDFHFSELGAATLGGIVARSIKPLLEGCATPSSS